MNNIIICEDNEIQRNTITSIIENEIKSFDCKIALTTDNPYKVINHIYNRKNSFIYFLDVNLNSDINGFELAQSIRTYDPNAYIIFLTEHPELALFTFKYKVQALDYIIKGDSKIIRSRIVECLKFIYDADFYNNKSRLPIDTDDSIIFLDYNDILFFETANKDHKISVHTVKGQYEFYGTLKNIEKTAPDYFCKSHRSYLINTKKIKSIDKNKRIAEMINRETCYISVRYMKKLLEKCF